MTPRDPLLPVIGCQQAQSVAGPVQATVVAVKLCFQWLCHALETAFLPIILLMPHHPFSLPQDEDGL